MATIPFYTVVSVSLALGASGTLSNQVGAKERLTIRKWRFIATGAFDVTGLRSSSGVAYSNASVANPIKSTHLQNAASPNLGAQSFDYPLVLEPSTLLNIDVKDTSGAPNVITFLLEGEKELL